MFVADDPLAVIAEQLDRLEAEDPANWSGPAQTQSTVGLLQLHGRLEAECARRAGIWEASGAWQADGSRYPTASLARRTGRSPGTCRRVLKVGRLAHTHDPTGKALASGQLPVDHAAQLANAVADREELYGDYETDLVEPASRLDSWRYAKLLETWKKIADDLLDRNREKDAHDKRRFSIAELLDGVAALGGTADAEGAAIIRKAIEAYTVLDHTDSPGPRRTPGQITYDALIAALEAAIGGPDGRVERHLDVIVSYETLLRLPPVDLEQARCEIVGVGPVDPSVLRRLAADSWLGRIIADGQGLPLDVGPQVRSHPRGQRRAIRYRDDTCIWPGCHLRGQWSHIDHAHDHALGGTTSVANGRFLCVRHHHLRHKGWQVTYDPATRHTQVTNPDGLTFTNDPDPPPEARPP